MARLLKPLLIALATFGLVWLAVIVWWQESRRSPDGADIVLWLFVLPAALLFLLWLFARGRKAAGARAAAALLAPTSPAPAKSAPGGVATKGEAQRGLWWALLASAQRSALGSSARDAAATLDDGAALPKPDAELTDGMGLPVFTARNPELDASALAEAREFLTEQVEAKGLPEPDWPDERLRALALALPVLDELLAVALTHTALANLDADPERDRGNLDAQDLLADPLAAAATAGVPTPGGARPSADLLSPTPPSAVPVAAPSPLEVKPKLAPLPWLRALLLLPADWATAERELFQQLLRARLDDRARAARWPAAQLALSVQTPAHGAEALLQLDKLLLTLDGDASRDLVVVLAADSRLGEATVAEWEGRGLLRSAARPNGAVPGEAAAGLLLALQAGATAFTEPGDEPPLRLHRPASAAREKPVTASGKASAAPLPLLAQQALAAAGVVPSEVQKLAGDAEGKPAHAAELALLVTETVPELDPVADVMSAGTVTGSCGVAATLAGLGLAHHFAQKTDPPAPVLFVASGDVRERAVAVVRGAPAEAPAA